MQDWSREKAGEARTLLRLLGGNTRYLWADDLPLLIPFSVVRVP